MRLTKDIKEYRLNNIRLFAISLCFMGVRFRKRGIKTKELAFTIAAKVRNDILNGTFDKRKYNKSDYDNTQFKVIVQKAYFEYGRANNRPATIRGKDSIIKNWILPVLGKISYDALSKEDFERLYRKAEEKNGNTSTSKYIASTLNAILRDAFKIGLVRKQKKAPSVSYKPVKAQRFLSKQEVRVLLESNKHHQISAIIACLYYCALRVSEVCALQVSDYNPTFKTLSITKVAFKGKLIEGTKNSTTGLIKVPSALVPYLDKQIEGKEPEDMLFHKMRRRSDVDTLIIQSVNTMVLNACKRAKIEPKGISTHIFRRSMSQHLIDSKVSPRSIAKYLRDKPSTILSHYASENTDEIRDTIDGF